MRSKHINILHGRYSIQDEKRWNTRHGWLLKQCNNVRRYSHYYSHFLLPYVKGWSTNFSNDFRNLVVSFSSLSRHNTLLDHHNIWFPTFSTNWSQCNICINYYLRRQYVVWILCSSTYYDRRNTAVTLPGFCLWLHLHHERSSSWRVS